MSAPAFWTLADSAELDLRVRDLVDAVHACGCGGAYGCEPCRSTIEDVVDWRDRRILQSRAEHLRREQLAADLRLERARLARTPIEGDLVRLLRETNPHQENARAA